MLFFFFFYHKCGPANSDIMNYPKDKIIFYCCKAKCTWDASIRNSPCDKKSNSRTANS